MTVEKENITPELIGSLELKEQPYFIRSMNYPGFRIKVNPKGRISFITYGRIHFGGNPRTITHGTTKTLSLDEAISKHIQCSRLLEQGKDPNLMKKSKNKQYSIGLNLENIAMQFIFDKEQKSEYSKNYADQCKTYLLKNKLQPLLTKNINQISTELITEWYKSLEETPTAANNALQFLSSVFSYAQTLNLIDTNSNPASIIRKLNLTYPTIRRDRQIDLESELPKILYRLWDPMNTHTVNRVTRNAIYLLLISGLKKSDVLNLKWGQISNKKFIKFKRRNNIQVYPINEYIQDVLDDMENIYKGKKGFNFKKAEDWVFRSPKNPSKNINNLRKTLNIYSTDFDWVIYPESFRKTFAKVADLAGIPRTHFYSLLGIKKPNYTYESIGSNNIHYNDLKKSLNKIHQAFDKLCPMQLPGIDQPLRHFMFNNNSNISML